MHHVIYCTSHWPRGPTRLANTISTNAILYAWCTFPGLAHQLNEIEQWGFEYRSIHAIWIKRNTRAGTPVFARGSYTAANAEILIVATKGVTPLTIKAPDIHYLERTDGDKPAVFAPPPPYELAVVATGARSKKRRRRQSLDSFIQLKTRLRFNVFVANCSLDKIQQLNLRQNIETNAVFIYKVEPNDLARSLNAACCFSYKTIFALTWNEQEATAGFWLIATRPGTKIQSMVAERRSQIVRMDEVTDELSEVIKLTQVVFAGLPLCALTSNEYQNKECSNVFMI